MTRRLGRADLVREQCVRADAQDHVVGLAVDDRVKLRNPVEQAFAELRRQAGTAHDQRVRELSAQFARQLTLPAERRDHTAEADQVRLALLVRGAPD